MGIGMLMGVVQMGAMTDYWSPNIRLSSIADAMTLRRYKILHSNIHFVDNLANHDPNDRYCKIRPILDHVRQNFLQIP